MEIGTVRGIDKQGRISIGTSAHTITAQISSGGGAAVGDVFIGDMRPGIRTWRNSFDRQLVVEVLEPVQQG